MRETEPARTGKLRRLTRTAGLAVIPLAISLASLALAVLLDPRWVAVVLAAALAYGFMSSVVAARRLLFLAGASAHSALLAAVLAIPLAATTALRSHYAWAVLVGLLLIYVVGYMIHRGIEPDTATAVFVAATASASALAIYYVLTRFPVQAELWAIVVGDPLLASWADAWYALAIASATALAVLLTYREQVYAGLDKEFVQLSGARLWAYDWLVFTLLALTTVGLIRVVGFVLEHALLLLPAAIATRLARSSKGVLLASVSVSTSAALVGLCLAVLTDQSPAGLIGATLLAAYLLALTLKRR